MSPKPKPPTKPANSATGGSREGEIGGDGVSATHIPSPFLRERARVRVFLED